MTVRTEIPYRRYWSTPFAKWQGSMQHVHSMKFAAWTTKKQIEKWGFNTDTFDHGVMGITINQNRSFWGVPYLSYLAGLTHMAGPTVSQACATGVRSLLSGAAEVESGLSQTTLVVSCDRLSNNPHIYYPAPASMGGTGEHENMLVDNLNYGDPNGGHTMLDSAENVARKHQITLEEQHDITARRYEQYQDALADNQAFQRRYMVLPCEIPDPKLKKVSTTLEGDEGIFPTTKENLAKLKPVLDEGTITFGSQTHPADGNCGMLITTPECAKELSVDANVRICLRGFGQKRVELAYMPEAPAPAAQQALVNANITLNKIDIVKTHNPFAVNDILFSRETGWDVMAMNNYGSSLIWGHPNAATGLRSVIELIEELVERGGGTGLFTGCSAGDSAMAVVIEVTNR